MANISIINMNINDRPQNNSCSNAFAELEMNQILRIKPINLSGKMTSYHITDYFTADIDTINHRLDIFDDLLNINDIYKLFVDILPALCDIADVSNDKTNDEHYDFLEYFHYIIKLEMYIDCVTKLYEDLTKVKDDVKSKGMIGFIDYITAIYENEEFKMLQTNLSELSVGLKNMKSITVGINLDNQMRLIDFGIVSTNSEQYKQGNLLDKILRADFSKKENDQYTCITSLTPILKNLSETQMVAVNNSFKSAFNSLLKKSLKNVQLSVSAYMKNCAKFLLDLIPEICFLIAGFDFIKWLKERGVAICKPKMSQNKHSHFKNLINPYLLNNMNAEDIISNDISFDESGMIYVLTGANSGGKSVFLYSLGIAQILFQLGLFVPAEEAVLFPADNISVHFPIKNTTQTSAGRLEQECIMLNNIIKNITPDGFVLMDETFSSTSAYDGSVLAEEILKYFASIGCKCVFSTHIHELAMKIDNINNNAKSTVKVDNLIAETDEGKRTYKISRKIPEGQSYAKDIAKKYGLLFDFIPD